MERKSRFIAAISLLIVFAVFLIYCTQNPKEYPKKMQAAYKLCKVRSGPGHEFDLVGWLRQGETVVVLGVAEDENNQTWYKINTKSFANLPNNSDITECYIRSDLLTDCDDTE